MVDPFEVYVLMELEDGVLLFPENLYECSRYSQFEFQELQLEMRNLDVYLGKYFFALIHQSMLIKRFRL